MYGMPLKTRTLAQFGTIKVVGHMYADPDADPTDQDFEDAEQARDFLARYHAGDFQYVGMVVAVLCNGRRIADDSMWGIEHGTVAEDVEADAWEFTPSQPLPDGKGYIAGSSLHSVAAEALEQAEQWLASIQDAETDLRAARQWVETGLVAD